MTMLDSHDTARFRTVVGGDPVRHIVGLAALLTMPGVPTLFAGVEVGCEGGSSDTARVPFPWDRLADLDETETAGDGRFLHDLRALVELRRRSDALRLGSMRWIDATADSVTYVRESPAEHVLVHLVRRACEARAFDAASVGIVDRRGADDVCAVEFGQADLVVLDVGAHTIVLPGTPGAYVVSCARR
jgi:alpha-glucosidase